MLKLDNPASFCEASTESSFADPRLFVPVKYGSLHPRTIVPAYGAGRINRWAHTFATDTTGKTQGRQSMSTLKPIKDTRHLEQLISEGYLLKGRREDPARDLAALKNFFVKGYELVPEEWLLGNGYELVAPSPFTKGHTLAYKLIDDFPDQYFRSGYSLVKGSEEVFLYLKMKEKV